MFFCSDLNLRRSHNALLIQIFLTIFSLPLNVHFIYLINSIQHAFSSLPLHLPPLAEGFPKVRYFTVDDYFSILVIDLLGPSLEKVFESRKRQFTIKTISLLGSQMVRLFNFEFLFVGHLFSEKIVCEL